MRTEASVRFSVACARECTIGPGPRCNALAELKVGNPRVQSMIPGARPPIHIRLRPERVNRLLGTVIPRDEMKLILMRLGFILNERDEGSYRVINPDHRMEVLQEDDQVEEIPRIN